MKRNLILTFLACGLGALMAAGAFAQTTPDTAATATTGTMPEGGPGADGRAGHLMQRLTSALGLSGSQQAAIAPILAAAQPQLQAIREQAKTARDGVINSVSAQVTPLLTGTQQARFAEMVQHLEEGPGPGGPGRAHPDAAGAASPGGKLKKFDSDDQLQHLTTALGLTPAQQTQIQPILEAAHTQIRSIITNTSLTPQQKMAQARAVFEAANGQINGILTPAQQTQFAALKQEHLHRKARGLEPAASPTPSPSA